MRGRVIESEVGRSAEVGGKSREVIWFLTSHCEDFGFYLERRLETTGH